MAPRRLKNFIRLACFLTAIALALPRYSVATSLNATAFVTQKAQAVQSVLKAEFIFERAPFPSCHASTVAEVKGRLVAAWFGGTRESSPDVGIWISRHDGHRWSEPVEVANGIVTNDTRHPCWNPVLFQPKAGPLMLFYKVGPSPQKWWGMLMTSMDGGRTWSKPRRLPAGIFGPIRSKPIQLADGSLLCPSSTEDAGWRVHIERTHDLGKTWKKTAPLNEASEFGGIIQPTILRHTQNRLQILCRSRGSRVVQSWSDDGGKTWSRMEATPLPNPSSGVDAVMLKDGRALIVYNHATGESPYGRNRLNVAVSENGKRWKAALVLEDQPGEYSYPAVIQTSDGLVHITYTWKRERIKHVVIDPRRLTLLDMPGGQWPKQMQ